MILEVGKSYRTRDNKKVTIINVDDDRNYPFKGDNKNCYKENGRVWRYHEDEIDLIAPWEDEPATPKFKEGDLVTVKLTNVGASHLNAQWGKLSNRLYMATPASPTPPPQNQNLTGQRRKLEWRSNFQKVYRGMLGMIYMIKVGVFLL